MKNAAGIPARNGKCPGRLLEINLYGGSTENVNQKNYQKEDLIESENLKLKRRDKSPSRRFFDLFAID